MSTSTRPDVQTDSPSAPKPVVPLGQPGSVSISTHNLISLSAAILCLAFFAPWVTFFGALLSGLDIQKNFESYKLVWMVPALGLVTLGLNMARAEIGFIRRVTGLVPLLILAYGLNRLGSDLLQILSWGGWLTLLAGLALIVIPSASKQSARG
jgi:hypothetical protein